MAMISRSLLLVLGLFFGITSLTAQQSAKVTTATGRTLEIFYAIKQSPGGIQNDSVFARGDTASIKRFIVQLKSSPLAKSLKQNPGARSAEISTEHNDFRVEIDRIKKQLRSAGKKASATVLYEYKNVMNGFVITANREEERAIRQLPQVHTVTEDRRIGLLDQTTNSVIKADRVWSDLGITGKGVVIAIIDTGIDYNHPDLGGGLGPGKKVIGGYDFVNNDFDPYDDNGHGTHVAGIAAANGSIKGVAPDANLVGYKVLGADGFGFDSWIVAAIERTVDPDQNPMTDDAVDIVNMSLGRAADRFDPYGSAISYATAYGVTFVVAGGNSYDYYTIVTPGISPDAITVGATHSDDRTATFSSKGPLRDNFVIKPDVAAPGTDVYSTMRNFSYSAESGTSMASPHVAGIAALIKEKFPHWTPLQIKSALMNSAKETNEPVWHQGAGRVDALKAIQAPFILSPGSISLGTIFGSAINSKQVLARVENLTTQSQSIQLSVTGELFQSGVVTSIQPSIVSLGPEESVEVRITFDIDPSVVPAQPFTEGHFGSLRAVSGNYEAHVPVALVYDRQAFLKLSTPLPDAIFVSNGETNIFYDMIVPVSSEQAIKLPHGKFDFLAVYSHSRNTLVLAENISTSGSISIDLQEQLAENHIRFEFNDQQGKYLQDSNDPFFPDSHHEYFFMRGMALNASEWTDQKELNRSYYVSDNLYGKFDVSAVARRKDKLYSVALGTPVGISESMDMMNDPSAFTTMSFSNPGNEEYYMQYVLECRNPNYPYDPSPVAQSLLPINTTILHSQQKDYFKFTSRVSFEPAAGSYAPKWEAGYFSVRENDILEITNGAVEPVALQRYETNDFRLELGKSLLHCSASMTHDGNTMKLKDVGFRYHSGERRHGSIRTHYTSESLPEGTAGVNFLNSTPDERSSENLFNLPPGSYTFQLDFSDYQLYKFYGKATYEMEFDSRNEDKTAPVITNLWIESKNQSTNVVAQGDPAKIHVEIFDCHEDSVICSGIRKASIIITSDVTDLKVELPVDFNAGLYTAVLPDTLSTGYYDLTVIGEDSVGNKVTYTLVPAFLIGTPPPVTKVYLLSPSNYFQSASRSPLFRFSSATDAISYTIQLYINGDFATVKEYTVNENNFLFPGELDGPGVQYSWRVKPNFESMEGEWSTIFSFSTLYEYSVNLISPVNGTVTNEQSAYLNWESGANYLQLQVASDPAFQNSQNIFTSDIFHNHTLFPNNAYYWRVRPMYRTNTEYDSWEYGAFSETFSFFSDRPINLYSPWDNDNAVRPDEVLLFWEEQMNVSSYTVFISTKADFSELISGSGVPTPNPWIVLFNLEGAKTFYWKVEGDLFDGRTLYSPVFSFTTDVITGVGNNIEVNSNAWPNPASEEAVIICPEAGEVTIRITDVHGRTLVDAEMLPGDPVGKSYRWHTSLVADGLYFCQVQSETKTEIVKLVIRH